MLKKLGYVFVFIIFLVIGTLGCIFCADASLLLDLFIPDSSKIDKKDEGV